MERKLKYYVHATECDGWEEASQTSSIFLCNGGNLVFKVLPRECSGGRAQFVFVGSLEQWQWR